MNHKKKQKATAAMATLLSVSTMINPMSVMAQEDGIASQDVTQKDEGQPIEKKTIGLPELPKNLKANAGTRLKEVKLPDYFTWVDGDTILSINTKEYAARYAVDDTMYDYTSIKGYHADGHYIEFELSIDVEAEDELTISAPIIKSLFTSNTSIPSTYDATGDIPIDEAHFPDAVFRDHLKKQYDTDNNDTLSAAEIANITTIDVSNKNIADMTGIGYFTELKTLGCHNIDIEVLNVSGNAKLTTLKCYDNDKLQTLVLSNASALETLWCQNTCITSLDVSTNSNLTTLWCYNTRIIGLDVSKNSKLTTLNCSSNEELQTLNLKGASALQTLNCYSTGITDLDVSNHSNLTMLTCNNNKKLQALNLKGASALQTLYCYSTGITDLDVSNHSNLKTLSCDSNEKLQTINVNGASALQTLDCHRTSITNLDVSNNSNLTTLNCYSNKKLQALNLNGASALQALTCNNTGISSLNVRNNPNLTDLIVSNNSLTSLDVSKNINLEQLTCSHNKISNLDLSKNINLKELYCYSAGLASLDVSKNTNLSALDCRDNSLAYLNFGKNVTLSSISINNPSKNSISMKDDSFNINEKFPGIDPAKITITGNTASITDTGIVSGYKAGTPITYDYDCGTINGVPQTLSVSLTLTGLKKETSIVITSTPAQLNKSYDNSPVSTPNVTKTGSTKSETYTWEQKKNGVWESIATAPVNAGTYRVTANVEADDNYKAAKSSPVVFTISQADNSWTKALTIDDWTYGKSASTPSATPKFGTGTVSYTYSNSETGTFKSDVPTNAGTWYVKASVIETDNYKGLEEVKQFEIKKATAPTLTLPSDLKGKQDALLSTIVLSKGWTWVKSDTSLTVNNSGYKARLIVDDANYDYTGVTGYNATGHYVEKTLTVSVAQGENTWTITPSITAWTYGEIANTPKGTAAHGTVNFTYSDSKTGTFKSDVPTNAGTWYMKATVAESNEYAELSKTVEFTISQADNSWTKALTIDDWTYGKSASTPSATPKFGTGTVSYTYSNSETGTFKSDVPTNAGTWYVKATVAKTDNYKGLEEVKQFEIKKASAPTLTLPSDLKGKQDALLSTIALPKGWTWVKDDTSLTVNNSGYKAHLTVDDANYDYAGVTGYNATGHYVERSLTVSVAQGENSWTVAPSIENWIYGETANIPKGTAAHGSVSFTYSDSKTGTFKSDVPTNAGTWYMKATVAESNEYAELSKTVEFTISQADNSWTKTLTIDDWTYGKTASTPSATPKFGTVVSYTYSDSKTGIFKSDVPSNAGIWYVKATIAKTDNYKGLEEVKQFEIKKATAPTLTLPTNLKGKQDGLLSSVTLPKGWTWIKGDTSLTVNNSGYKARFAVDDANYDYTGVTGYNATGHYVERTLTVSVAQGENTWMITPSITDWTYGETANTPKGTAAYGTVKFTYSDSKTGTFKSDVPTSAGTWYMKATVAESDEYAELSTIIAFTIKPKNVETDISVPDITSDTDLSQLQIKDGTKLLIQGVDYEISKVQTAHQGKVTIQFKGNYSGTIVKTYSIKGDSSSTNTPTGDTSSVGLWTILMTLAGGFIALLKGKKQKEE